MKKWSKIILIVLLILICIIALDTLQAKIFNNSPLIKIRYNKDGGLLDYVDKGILVNHYYYTNKEEKTVFKWNLGNEEVDLAFEKIDNMAVTLNAVVIKVYENSLDVMEIGEDNSLLKVSFSEEGNIGFKQGQEIRIYFNGMINATYPGGISNVGKIEILKEESDIEIPDDYIRYYESSENNVSISINEFTPTGLTFTITDKNELPYNYSNNYEIYKEVRNEDYTGVGEKIGEDTGNSTSAYTGTGIEFYWEELKPISNVKKEDTVETLVYNLPAMTENDKYTVTGRKFNWTKLYGKLEERKV